MALSRHARIGIADSSYTVDYSALSHLFEPSGKLRVVMRHEQKTVGDALNIALLRSPPLTPLLLT